MGRLDYIDGLRAIAATLVVLHHGFMKRLDVFGSLVATISIGRLGVLLFFLISGFIIAPSASSENFLLRRAYRLLPALWLSVLAFGLIWIAEGKSLTLATVLGNMGMIARPLGLPELSSIYWTLTYELGFYIACFALARLGQLHNVRVIGALASLSAIYGAAINWEEFVLPGYFAVGMLLREMRDGNASAGPWLTQLIVVLAAAGTIVSVNAGFDPNLQPIAKGVAMLLPLLIFPAFVAWQQKVHPRLVYFGAISYSLYLFHEVVMFVMAPTETFFGWTFPFAVLLVSLALAAAIYRYVEAPFIAVGRRRKIAATV